MFFLEINDKIFGYDNDLCITFEYDNGQWRISSIPLHDIEQMNLFESHYLTIEEVKYKVDVRGLNVLRKRMKKIYKENITC